MTMRKKFKYFLTISILIMILACSVPNKKVKKDRTNYNTNYKSYQLEHSTGQKTLSYYIDSSASLITRLSDDDNDYKAAVNFDLNSEGVDCIITGFSYRYLLNYVENGQMDIVVSPDYMVDGTDPRSTTVVYHTSVPIQMLFPAWRDFYLWDDVHSNRHYVIDRDISLELKSTTSVGIDLHREEYGGFGNGHSYYTTYPSTSWSNYNDNEFLIDLHYERVETLSVPDEVTGILVSNSDMIDAYKIYLEAGKEYKFDLAKATGTNFRMRLVEYKSVTDTTLVAYAGSGTPLIITYTPATTKDYILIVESESPSDGGSYSLLVTDITDPPPEEEEFKLTYPNINDVFENAPSFDIEINDISIDTIWYTIDGGVTNITCGTSGTIDSGEWSSLSDGFVTLTFYGNDTSGIILSDSISIIKDTTNPIINITSPTDNKLFGETAPSFRIDITEKNQNTTWYTFNGSAVKYIITSNGTIDSDAWDDSPDGLINLTFYINDTLGKSGSDSILIIKDTIDPIITINNLLTNQEFEGPPTFSLTIDEDNLDSIWYTVDGGITNYTCSASDTINLNAWEALSEGKITITFYIKDTANNVNSTSIQIYKVSTSIKKNGEPDNFIIIILVIIIIIGAVSIGGALAVKKNKISKQATIKKKKGTIQDKFLKWNVSTLSKEDNVHSKTNLMDPINKPPEVQKYIKELEDYLKQLEKYFINLEESYKQGGITQEYYIKLMKETREKYEETTKRLKDLRS